MRRCQCTGLFVTWACLIACSESVSGVSRISKLSTTIPRRPLSPLWGIRGGADETQEETDINAADNESNENKEEEQEASVVLTTEEDESSVSKEDASPETDHVDDVSDVSVVIEEDNKTEEDESKEESTETLEQDEEMHVVMDDESITVAREEAQELRQQGKDLHDDGDWTEAAVKFYEASTRLQDYVEDEDLLQEYVTCRLHEALCRLKIHDYQQSVEACTAVLEREPPAAIRARALHRRSRAKLGLGLKEEALQDARQAAFLGDRKAVVFYGKLMRQDSAGSESSSLHDLLQGDGSNPFLSSGDAASSSTLLESLLNKSSDSGSAPSGGPMSMLMNNGKNGGGGLAKSVLSSLSKIVENESTQESICRYLQNTNVGQVQQMAAVAGFPLSDSYAARLVSFCHGVTPKGIRKSVKTTKILIYVVSLLRKMAQIVSKYRFVLILWALSIWIKSACRRSIPINKRAARLAMKQAMKQGAV